MELIVVKMNPAGTAVEGYWDGTSFQANIDLSEVYTSLADARFAQGSIQTQDTSFDVRYREANVVITLI